MVEAFTPFGIIEYDPPWLEQNLEESLLSHKQLYLPPARTIDMNSWPRRIQLCRYLIASHYPFEAVIYNKELTTEDKQNLNSLKTGDDMLKTILNSLRNPEFLQDESIRFVMIDGLVTLRHQHRGKVKCDDKSFSVTWGGGDLSTCPYIAVNEEKRYDSGGIVFGRQECLHALDSVIKEGGISLEY